jgi:hypothetical protein
VLAIRYFVLLRPQATSDHFDHKVELEATASMLDARIKAERQEGKVVNVLEMQEELMIAMDALDNPFVLDPTNDH